MKKLFFGFCLIFSVCFFSCYVYVPEKDYSKILEKQEYKSFNHLNKPFVLKLNTYLDFLAEKDNGRVYERRRGAYYVIYDWETESVFDFVYVPSDNSNLNYSLPQRKTNDGSCVYINWFYDYTTSENKYYFMNSSGNKIERLNRGIHLDEDFSDYGGDEINSSDDESNVLALIYKDEDKIKFTYIDVNTKDVFKEKIIKKDGYFSDCWIDATGTIWFVEIQTKEENKEYAYFGYYNYKNDELKKNCFEFGGTWENNYSYSITYSDEQFLIIEKKEYGKDYKILNKYSYLIMNKKNNEDYLYDEIYFENKSIEKVYEYKNEYYLFSETDDYSNREIYKLNQEKNGVEFLHENTENLYRMNFREEKVFFINVNEEDTRIAYYDVLNNEFKEMEGFVLDDVLKSVE
ncbi:MAG: hypothetical protein IJZ71_08455 [Treponema sp.]|nr:hypothetical protein [Treponema sp.]